MSDIRESVLRPSQASAQHDGRPISIAVTQRERSGELFFLF
jgi:hypothetical protein